MATGINSSEKVGKDAVVIEATAPEPFPLPATSSPVYLEYEHKISLEELREMRHRELILATDHSSSTTSASFDNSLIWSDNLFGLSSLCENYAGKVNLIYLDPPYATGFDFHSRDLQHAYNDSYQDAAYIEFMRRRLLLMRELLADDGSIYIHIGHQMLFHLKIVMDEIFGKKNFRNLITRRKCSSKNSTRNQYPNLNDFILFYSKTSKFKWNRPGTPPSEEWVQKEYNKKDKKGKYKLVPIHAPGTRKGSTGRPWRGMMPPPGKHWQLTPDKLDELDRIGDIHWSRNGNPRRKVYLPADKMLPVTDYWDNFRDAHHQSIKISGYPTEKNLDMLKLIVSASSNEGDLVLDPFCGSGTTLQATIDLNRKFIGIDQSSEAIKTSIKRLRFGNLPMGDYVNNENDLSQLELISNLPPRIPAASALKIFVDQQFFEENTDLVHAVIDVNGSTTP